MFICRICRRFYPEKISPVEHSGSETKKPTYTALIFSIFDSFKRIFSTLRSWCADLKVMIIKRKNDKMDKVASCILTSIEGTEKISLNFTGVQPEVISDVTETVSPQTPLMPHEIPLPSPTKEELEWFKADAQDWNSQNSYLSFPIDIHTHILSYLTEPEDIKNTSEVSECLNKATIECLRARTNPAKKAIAEIIQFAQLFDREIQRITESTNQEGTLVRESILEDTTLETVPHKVGYHRFQFNVKKWEKLLVDLDTKVDLATMADKIKEDCRLDLVEALAEYNIGTQTVLRRGEYLQDVNSPDRFLSRINLSTISKNLSRDRIERMNEILDEAKGTVKGDFFIYSSSNRDQLVMYVWLLNKESDNWSCHDYPRHRTSYEIHLDRLMGKREGDRILVPTGKGDDRQTLLRCFQTRYRYRDWGSFEEVVITRFLRMDSVDIKIKNEVLEKIKKAYGNKLVDSFAKKLRKKTENQMKSLDLTPVMRHELKCRLDWFDEHFST